MLELPWRGIGRGAAAAAGSALVLVAGAALIGNMLSVASAHRVPTEGRAGQDGLVSGPTSPWLVAGLFGAAHDQADLTSIDAASAQDAWAVGFTVLSHTFGVRAMITHWTGKTWQQVALPASVAAAWDHDVPIMAQVGASSPANVWVFNGILQGPAHYLRLSGTTWSTGTLPMATADSRDSVLITGAKVFSAADVWAFGMTEHADGTKTPYAAHFDGRAWATVPVPGTGAITSVAAGSPASMWAVLGVAVSQDAAPAALPVVLHWTAKRGWRRARVQPALPRHTQLSSVAVTPAGTVWIGGESGPKLHRTKPLTAFWSGSKWTVAKLLVKPAGTPWDIVGLAASQDGVWALARSHNQMSERLWHLSGTTWTAASPKFGSRAWKLDQIAAVPGTQAVWGAGAVRYNGTVDAMVARNGAVPGSGPAVQPSPTQSPRAG